MAQCIPSCSVFARDDGLNVHGLSESYFLSSMMNGDQLDPGSFLAHQLYSAATSTAGWIVIRPQVHGDFIANQGLSHRDLVDSYIWSR